MISGSKEPHLVTGIEGSQFAWAEILHFAKNAPFRMTDTALSAVTSE